MSDIDKIGFLGASMAGHNVNPEPNTQYWHSPVPRDINILQKLKNKSIYDINTTEMNDIKRWILVHLGAPTVKVELTDEMLDMAIKDAINVYARYAGKTIYAYTICAGRQSEFDWPCDALAIDNVYYRPAYLGSLGNVNQMLFSDFYLLATDLAVDIYESPVTFWAYMSSREMLEKTYGVWGSWEIVDGRRFRIYPTPIRDHIIGVKYKSKNIDLNQDDDLHNLLRRFALTYAKEMLGRIRSKFAQLPGSGNTAMTLDGNALLAEADRERKEVMAELAGRNPLSLEKF